MGLWLFLMFWGLPVLGVTVLMLLVLFKGKGAFKLMAFIPYLAYFPLLTILSIVMSMISNTGLPFTAWIVYNYVTVIYSYSIYKFVMNINLKKLMSEIDNKPEIDNNIESNVQSTSPLSKLFKNTLIFISLILIVAVGIYFVWLMI